MNAYQTFPDGSWDGLHDALPADRQWHCVGVIVDGHLDAGAASLALQVAQRDGARVVLYDVTRSPRGVSPFPPGEKVRPFLLQEPDLRRVGRHELADALRDIKSSGATAGAHLSTVNHAGDLSTRTQQEKIDLIICPIPLEGRRIRAVHESRKAGASLLECVPGQPPVFHPPLAAGEPVPMEERVQIRLLVGLIVTFLAAGLRNRARS